MKRTSYCLYSFLLSFSLSLPVCWAAGMEVPELGTNSVARGGAITASVKEPTAAFLNPGALTRLKGFNVQLSHNLIWLENQFQQRVSEGEPRSVSANQEELFPLGVFGAITYDFGTDHSRVALSAHGPNTSGYQSFDNQSSSRYLLNEIDVLLIYYGLSYAYGNDDFGLGVTLQYVQLPRLNFQLVADASYVPYVEGRQDTSFDVGADLQLKDQGTVSAIVGGWWRATKNLELGFSSRVMPIELNPEGDAYVRILDEMGNLPAASPALVEISDITAKTQITLPRFARLGGRYVHQEKGEELFDVELNVMYTQWSSLDKYAVELDGQVKIITFDSEISDVTIDKAWKDAWTINAGGGYWLLPKALQLQAGLYWESAAAEPGYAHLDFPAGERYGFGTGITYFLKSSDNDAKIGLSLAYGETIHRPIEVGAGEGRVYKQRPLAPCPDNCDGSPGAAVNEGRFDTHHRTLSASIVFLEL